MVATDNLHDRKFFAVSFGMPDSSGWGHDMDNADNRKFVSGFEAEYKRLPPICAAMAYDTAMLIDAAVRDVKGRIEVREAVIKALRAKRFTSVTGRRACFAPGAERKWTSVVRASEVKPDSPALSLRQNVMCSLMLATFTGPRSRL